MTIDLWLSLAVSNAVVLVVVGPELHCLLRCLDLRLQSAVYRCHDGQ
jgi:hypothetical protein